MIRILLTITFIALLSACGNQKQHKHSHDHADRSEGTKTSSEETTGGDLTQVEGPSTPEGSSTAEGPTPEEELDMLVGTFAQDENRASKIRISDLHRVETNLTIPVNGGAVRLSPEFPHRLRHDQNGGYWSTTGFFNQTQDTFDNVELRVDPFDEGRLLDVTLVLKLPLAKTGDNGDNDSTNCRDSEGQCRVGQPSECCPVPGPFPPPCPGPWLPPPCWDYCCCCPNPGGGSSTTVPREDKIYVYRYVRVDDNGGEL